MCAKRFNYLRLIIRSLVYYKKSAVLLIAGSAVSAAVLTGAFLTGDSVKYSLKRINIAKLGDTVFALSLGERDISAESAGKFSESISAETSSLFVTESQVKSDNKGHLANRVKVYGTDRNFWKIAGRGESVLLDNDTCAVNRKLALALGLEEGDEVLVRIKRGSLVPGDLTFVSSDKGYFTRRFVVKYILSEASGGDFSLEISQLAPENIFLKRSVLASVADRRDSVNTIICSGSGKMNSEFLETKLRNTLTLDDMGIIIDRFTDKNSFYIKSRRVFFDPDVSAHIRKTFIRSEISLTYFVNSIEKSKEEFIPYSFVTGLNSSEFPGTVKPGEIILNSWAKRDLSVRKGDKIRLAYYLPDSGRGLVTDKHDFIVSGFVDINDQAKDAVFMPDFPGLNDKETCREWEPGIPLDNGLIRQVDEEYWKKHRGTPKGYINYKTASDIWGNRFGAVTGIKVFYECTLNEFRYKLLKSLKELRHGIVFHNVRARAEKAASESVDFGILFTGLSFFIILSSLFLTGIFSSAYVNMRRREIKVLRSTGAGVKKIYELFFTELLVLVLAGSLAGACTGIIYNEIIIFLLGNLWSGTTGTSDLRSCIEISSVAKGAIITFFLSLSVSALSLKSFLKREFTTIVREGSLFQRIFSWKISLFSGLLINVMIFAILSSVSFGNMKDFSSAFWIAGVLVIPGMGLLYNGFFRFIKQLRSKYYTLFRFALKGVAYNYIRSTAVILMLGAGVFVVISVGMNRKVIPSDPWSLSSGTGGFAIDARTTLPVRGEELSEFLRSNKIEKYSAMKFYKGNDASCLNLNKVEKPSLTGVNTDELRGTFNLSDITGMKIDWDILDREENGAIPALIDRGVLVWGLGKEIGDRIKFRDERGELFDIIIRGVIDNSVFQGSLLISVDKFMKLYPSETGFRRFLLSSGSEGKSYESEKRAFISEFSDLGAEVKSTVERLETFYVVENTYLSIFMALGTLGIIIGIIGSGLVFLNDLVRKKAVVALVKALGFSSRDIRRVFIIENLFLFLSGIVLGLVAASLTVMPVIMSSGSDIPYVFMFIIVLALIFSSYILTRFLSSEGVRRIMPDSLSSEETV